MSHNNMIKNNLSKEKEQLSKILVTGCAGFIGSHLCEKLLELGHIVVGIDIINDYYDIKQKLNNIKIIEELDVSLHGKDNRHFKFIKDDIIDTKIISDVNNNENQKQFDTVIHLAAMAGVRYSIENPTHYVRTNVEGQTNLLNQCVNCGVKKFIYASSSSVYGMNKKVPFSEKDTINKVNSPYAATKRSCEIMAQLYNQLYGINVIGLRFFTVYGPRGRPDMAPFKFLKRIMNKTSIDKYGEGNSYRDYTYIDDIVDGILGSLTVEKSCEIYNLGNTTTVTLNEFIETCEKVTGNKAIINQMPEQKGDVPFTYSDINKAKTDFGYSPSVNLEEGLTRMFNWMKKN